MKKLLFLDILSDEKITVKDGSPADILQSKLEKKWKFENNDLDLIIMQHQFEFDELAEDNKKTSKRITSTMVVKGQDYFHTAIANTVGLPAAIAAKLILNTVSPLNTNGDNNNSHPITDRGVCIPLSKQWYNPILDELEQLGIIFEDIESVL